MKPSRRQPRQPQQTDRQKRTEAYEAEWEKNCRKRTEACEAEWEKNRRPAAGQKRQRDLRGQDWVLMTEMAGDSTGDPRFRDFLELWKSYGFDREFQRNIARAESKAFGDPDDGYLVQVNFFRRPRRLRQGDKRPSIIEACEHVVAKFGVSGKTFEHAVERLRKAYLVSDYYAKEISSRKTDQQKSKT